MLGDVGSNVLGAVVGFSFMVNFSWTVNLVVVGVLVVLQLYAEKYSITKLISRIGVLRWLDEFGRKGNIG
jgi:UDP-N-acetylmuramyl pentapeptide phosphotransferase/UDP-N-acetylglucosamine-1-phosphate transferase